MTKLRGMRPWKKARRSSKKEINILLAEKYGWEAVECYIQEPLVCDPDDEKCIRRVVKESKAFKSDNNKSSKPRATFARSKQPFTLNQDSSSARRVIIPALKHKLDSSQSEVCFRCGRAGHFAKNCHAPTLSIATGKMY